jgi:hypothetical protein
VVGGTVFGGGLVVMTVTTGRNVIGVCAGLVVGNTFVVAVEVGPPKLLLQLGAEQSPNITKAT